MSKSADRLLSEVHNYLNSPTAQRIEWEINGTKPLDPDPEEQNLSGYEFSQADANARLGMLVEGTASLLRRGPSFYPDKNVFIYKGTRDVAPEGQTVIAEEVSASSNLEFIARHRIASRIATDSDCKLVRFEERLGSEVRSARYALSLGWKDQDSRGRIVYGKHTVLFGPHGPILENVSSTLDGSRPRKHRSPLPESMFSDVEAILLNIQGIAKGSRG